MTTSTDALVADYLARLQEALSVLPAAQREQLMDEIGMHIAEGRAGLDPNDKAGLRDLLDAVGDPASIAQEALAGAPNPRRASRADAFVPWLLLVGGYAFLGGWVVGVCLLWFSATWRLRDKLLGTLVVPGGLSLSFWLLFLLPFRSSTTTCRSSSRPIVSPGLNVPHPAAAHCTTSGFSLPLPVGILAFAFCVVAPIVVAVHLERVRRRA
jgi:hypothetical protein